MKLSTVFDEDRIIIHPETVDLREVVVKLVATLDNAVSEAKRAELVDLLLNRETENSTLIQGRACILHYRMPELNTMLTAVAVMGEPIKHPSDEAARLRMVFLILAPKFKNTLMLQTMAAIDRLVASKQFMTSVKSIKAESRFIRMVDESGIDIKSTLTAIDVMDPIEAKVSMGTPFVEAVNILCRVTAEGLPVVDDAGKLVGEFTTRDILILGMPKYMDLLSNPEMLNEFEPFENYFENEDNIQVRDVCRKDFCAVRPSEPVIKVAHQMITDNRRRIYVVSDDKIQGVIQRKNIVKRVLNS